MSRGLLTHVQDTSKDLCLLAPAQVEYPTTNSSAIAQASLAITANEIYSDSLSAQTRGSGMSINKAAEMEQKLLSWKVALPSYFRSYDSPDWFHGPRAIVFWKEENLRLIIWSGVQQSSDLQSMDSLNYQTILHRRMEVAMDVVQSITSFCFKKVAILNQNIIWYAVYYQFQAILALDAGLMKASTDDLAPAWEHALSEARRCLCHLGTWSPSAARCVSILDRIRERRRRPCREPSNNTEVPPVTQPRNLSSFDSAVQQADMENFNSNLSIDPALQPYMQSPSLWDLFDGFEGFPNTQEEYFDYVLGNQFDPMPQMEQ